MTNKEYLEWLGKYIKKYERQEFKKKLKENYYDIRLNREVKRDENK